MTVLQQHLASASRCPSISACCCLSHLLSVLHVASFESVPIYLCMHRHYAPTLLPPGSLHARLPLILVLACVVV